MRCGTTMRWTHNAKQLLRMLKNKQAELVQHQSGDGKTSTES